MNSSYSDTSAVVSEIETPIEAVQETVQQVSNFWISIGNWFLANWVNFVICGVILVGGWWLSKLITHIMRKALKRTNMEKSAITFLCSISKYFLRFLVIIFSLYPFGVQLATVFAALGAAGLGLSLGLRESVSNFASGIQIIFTKPFAAGDYIAINNFEGTVQRVEIMYTTLKTLEHHEVVIPNATLTAGTITNYTAQGVRRATLNFNVQYGQSIAQVRKIVLDICQKHEKVLGDPAPIFVVNGQGSDGVLCSLRVYTTPENYWTVFWDVNELISEALYAQGIRLPFNQLDVHLVPPEEPEDAPPKNKKHKLF